jgi:hypothetical protein
VLPACPRRHYFYQPYDPISVEENRPAGSRFGIFHNCKTTRPQVTTSTRKFTRNRLATAACLGACAAPAPSATEALGFISLRSETRNLVAERNNDVGGNTLRPWPPLSTHPWPQRWLSRALHAILFDIGPTLSSLGTTNSRSKELLSWLADTEMVMVAAAEGMNSCWA